MQPCIVQWVNDGRTYFYIGASWAVAVSYLVVAGVDKTLCWAILISGCVIMVALGVWQSFVSAAEARNKISVVNLGAQLSEESGTAGTPGREGTEVSTTSNARGSISGKVVAESQVPGQLPSPALAGAGNAF